MSREDGKVEFAIYTENHEVFIRFKEPMSWLAFKPETAFATAEQLARQAHLAKFGELVPADESYLASQIRARLTDAARDRMVARIALMLHSLRGSPKSDGEVAMHVVDTIFNEIDK